MKQLVSDKELDGIRCYHNKFVERLGREIRRIRKELDDAHARIRELEDDVLTSRNMFLDADGNRAFYQAKYNSLREAVLFFVNQTKGRVTDGRLAHYASFKRLVELTEDSAQMASNRKPKAYLTRHDLEGGGDE